MCFCGYLRALAGHADLSAGLLFILQCIVIVVGLLPVLAFYESGNHSALKCDVLTKGIKDIRTDRQTDRQTDINTA